jgi:hypothetical protein
MLFAAIQAGENTRNYPQKLWINLPQRINKNCSIEGFGYRKLDSAGKHNVLYHPKLNI